MNEYECVKCGEPCDEEEGLCEYCQDASDEYNYDDPMYDDIAFADPGGNSALRAATDDNPRSLPCPTCGEPNRLTPADRALGYQCNRCADRHERDWDY